ncbi:MAG: glycosyltransferase family 2 protein [Paludibacteraceae bacterium]|nr:glycosyltransferase family 2 protein [Paludibacteraceae bacterium]
MNDLVSIIVPCFNQAEYLAETLDSVLAQTYPHWECIIVNDGSPDNTEEIAIKYCNSDNRFIYYYKNNGGLADTRNYGIRRSHGKYILPLDSDDKIASTYLEKAVKCHIENPQLKLVYTKVMHFGVIEGECNMPKYNYDRLLHMNHIVCTCMYKREDYDKTIGYNPNMIYGLEDWDFLISLLDPNDLVIQIDEPLFFYRQKECSMITQLKPKQNEMRLRIIHNHLDVYQDLLLNFLEYYDNGIDYKALYFKICSSYAYRLGKLLLKPLLWMRRLLS